MNEIPIKSNKHRKEQLRQLMREKRDAIDPLEAKAMSDRITKNVLASEAYKRATRVMSFYSFGSEVDTSQLLNEIFNNKQLVLPRVFRGNLECRQVRSLENLNRSSFGILEPNSRDSHVSATEIDLIIVPGLVFDVSCHRVGYGAGHYDKLLENYTGITLGICFDFQIQESLEADDWDVPLQMLQSEKRLIKT